MNLKVIPLLLVSVLFLSGCGTMAVDNAATGKGTGMSRTYSDSYETVWQTIPEAITSLGLHVVSTNRDEGFILAEHSMNFMTSVGERVAVYVDKIDDFHTRVEVVSRRLVATHILAPNWEGPVLNKLGELLLAKTPQRETSTN